MSAASPRALPPLLRADRPVVAIGLMSGTSADGIDAAVVRLRDRDEGGLDCETLGFRTDPLPKSVRRRILDGSRLRIPALLDLDDEMGMRFAEAAARVRDDAGIPPDGVHMVGSHGQTLFHRPPSGERPGVTLQVGRASRIAERMGCPVVSDFRQRDLVLGGQGAPLVPRVDRLLFWSPREHRILLNLGGIANITALSSSGAIFAFDTGPGNALMDALVALETGDRDAFDPGGERALRGRSDPSLLGELMRHPFLAESPPRAADRAAFGRELAKRVRRSRSDLSLSDALATAAEWTARSVARALEAVPEGFRPVARVIASGGGIHNAALWTRLQAALSPVPLETTATYGVSPDAKEAIAFAILARETMLGRPANVPEATGAARAAILGAITP